MTGLTRIPDSRQTSRQVRIVPATSGHTAGLQILSTLLHPNHDSTAPQRYLAIAALWDRLKWTQYTRFGNEEGCYARSTKRH
jgi:hypothetical protein